MKIISQEFKSIQSLNTLQFAYITHVYNHVCISVYISSATSINFAKDICKQ